jgi:hypothetical protein
MPAFATSTSRFPEERTVSDPPFLPDAFSRAWEDGSSGIQVGDKRIRRFTATPWLRWERGLSRMVHAARNCGENWGIAPCFRVPLTCHKRRLRGYATHHFLVLPCQQKPVVTIVKTGLPTQIPEYPARLSA